MKRENSLDPLSRLKRTRKTKEIRSHKEREDDAVELRWRKGERIAALHSVAKKKGVMLEGNGVRACDIQSPLIEAFTVKHKQAEHEFHSDVRL